jgi:hypothetical protein
VSFFAMSVIVLFFHCSGTWRCEKKYCSVLCKIVVSSIGRSLRWFMVTPECM